MKSIKIYLMAVSLILSMLLPSVVYSQNKLGDVTGDWEVDGKDALKILRIADGLITGTATDSVLGDVDPRPGTGGRFIGDGQLTQEDAYRILRFAVGLITNEEFGFPIITAVKPSIGLLGTPISNFEIRGKNLTDVNEIAFIPSEGITVTNLTVAGDSLVTADIEISSDAPVGERVVLVGTVTAGSSDTTKTETNKFIIAQPILVEVETPAGFRPADFSIVPTNIPTVRITLPSVSIDSVVVFLNDTVDITPLFGDLLDNRIDTAAVDTGVIIGNNTITVEMITTDTIMTESATILNFTSDIVAIAGKYNIQSIDSTADGLYQTTTLILNFDDYATTDSISLYLTSEKLLPIGLIQDITIESSPLIIIVDISRNIRGLDAIGLSDILNTYADATPLEFAMPNFLSEDEEVAGEALPQRLIDGNRAPPAPGNENIGDAYDPNTGGFDNDDQGAPNDDFDELDIAWYHFFQNTFAALRLRDRIVEGTTTLPDVPVLAVIDGGFGDGGANSTNNPGILRGRFGVTDPAGVRFEALNIIDVMVVSNINPWFDATLIPVPVRRDITQIPDLRAPRGHGHPVTITAAGNGARILGTGRDVDVLPIRYPRPNVGSGTPLDRIIIGLTAAAVIPEVDVINGSWRLFPNTTPVEIDNVSANVRPALNLARRNCKIFVNSGGNRNNRTTDIENPRRLAPVRGTRGQVVNDAAGNRLDYPLFLVVAGTDIGNDPRGPERSYWDDLTWGTTTGPHISVCAAAYNLVVERPDGDFRNGSGTSFAAPKVAGLAAELIEVDEALRGAPAAGQLANRRLQIVEIIETTADDLGTNRAAAPFTNNDAGNGPDNKFGWGRINAWKAMLAVSNGGISREGRSDANNPGFDDQFTSLPLILPEDALWYGFKITTGVCTATVWIDGNQLEDAGASIPKTPQITTYRGVRPYDDGTGRGTRIQGTVPVGTQVDPNGNPLEGAFVTVFSIERTDLVNNDKNSTAFPYLKLLRPNATDIVYKLPLHLEAMRADFVPGVTFDDFVFEVKTDFRIDQADETGGAKTARSPSVAGDSVFFAVAWEDWRNGASHIYARVYDFRGNPAGTDKNADGIIGDDFMVTPSWMVDVFNPAVAATDNRFIVVWNRFTDRANVFARIYDLRNGEPIGGQFKVDLGTAQGEAALYPRVAVTHNPFINRFMVTWVINNSHVKAKVYDLEGEPWTDEFIVDQAPDMKTVIIDGEPVEVAVECDTVPSIASNENGFIVTWADTRNNTNGPANDLADMHNFDIFARRYTLNGQPVGDDFRVDAPPSDVGKDGLPISAWRPSVASTNDHFVITWIDSRNGDMWDSYIYAKVYNTGGGVARTDFRVDQAEAGFVPDQPCVAETDSSFVVSWLETKYEEQAPWRPKVRKIMTRRYDWHTFSPLGADWDGNNTIGDAFRVDRAPDNDLRKGPSVSGVLVDKKENFFFSWTEGRIANFGFDTYGIIFTPPRP
jgi:hypothetical protein